MCIIIRQCVIHRWIDAKVINIKIFINKKSLLIFHSTKKENIPSKIELSGRRVYKFIQSSIKIITIICVDINDDKKTRFADITYAQRELRVTGRKLGTSD